MIRYIFKTKDRQGEFLKTKYDGKTAPNGWNHYQHPNKKKVEQYALKNNLKGWIEKILY